MQTLSSLQVLPAATDNTTYYVAMQPTTAGRTNYNYAATGLTYNPATGTVTAVKGAYSSLSVASTTDSVSNTTGALVVAGGVGIAGNINATGNVIITTTGSTGVLDPLQVVGAGNMGIRIVTLANTATDYAVIRFFQGGGERGVIYTNQGQLNFGINGATVAKFSAPGDFIPNANLTYNLGSTTAWWNTVYGKSVQAQYADLAEMYTADTVYDPGTVVVFGGSAEVTTTTITHDTRVAGVVSTDPAYLMNSVAAGIPVAMTGRVPCLVRGPVAKGTVLVTSVTPGVAQAIDHALYRPGAVVGKSLAEIADTSIQTIEVVVGRF
jgi:hypothetical protein